MPRKWGVLNALVVLVVIIVIGSVLKFKDKRPQFPDFAFENVSGMSCNDDNTTPAAWEAGRLFIQFIPTNHNQVILHMSDKKTTFSGQYSTEGGRVVLSMMGAVSPSGQMVAFRQPSVKTIDGVDVIGVFENAPVIRTKGFALKCLTQYSTVVAKASLPVVGTEKSDVGQDISQNVPPSSNAPNSIPSYTSAAESTPTKEGIGTVSAALPSESASSGSAESRIVSATPGATAVAITEKSTSSVTPPKIDFSSCSKPIWPPTAITNEETGTVSLQFLIGTNGSVIDSKVTKSSGFRDLDKAAKDGLALCRFSPKLDNGVPVEGHLHMQYVWALPNL